MNGILGTGVASVLFLLAAALMTTYSAPLKLVTIRGRLIAYRPFDQAAQMVSYILNKEVFLLQAAASDHGKKPKIVKVSYTHFGFSDITGDVLEGNRVLEVRGSRDHSCDESYGHLISTAPVIKILETTSSVDRIPDLNSARPFGKPIEFTAGFTGSGLSSKV